MKRAVMILVLALALLSGCGGGESAGPPGNTEPAEERPAAAETPAAKEEAEPPPAAAAHKTPEEQIDVFLEHEALWYQSEPEHDPAFLYYAVTDLNQNGRLELLRSEYKYDTDTSFNRFFELDAAETGVVELPYDLAETEDGEIAPGLVNADLPANCFLRDGAYHYRLPTPFEGESEILYMLAVEPEGGVSSVILGEKWVNAQTGESTYIEMKDGELREIGATDYYKLDYTRYEGCHVCECSWECVMLLDSYEPRGEAFRENLLRSWEAFVFSDP